MGLFKSLKKNLGTVVSPLTGFGTLFDKMKNGGGNDYGPGPTVDPALYSQYNDLYKNMPGEMQDPTAFYTPEIQQAVLDQLSQQANEQNAQDQAAISGGAIRGGFGVGGTSREATRRAKADANALDTIINGTINQAAQIETMRVQQQQDYASKKQDAQQQQLNDQQRFRLAQQGYAQNEQNTANSLSDQAKSDRQNLIWGGIGAGAGAFGSALGSGLFSKQNPGTYNPAQPLFGGVSNPITDKSKLSLGNTQYDYLGRRIANGR